MVRESFGSKAGFIFAAASSSVGLGNLWRFPYLIERYGGGMFILIYIIASLIFGLILMIAEVAIGRKTGKSVIEAYGDLAHKYKWLGWVTLLVPIVLMSYYCSVGGWVIKYAFAFIVGDTSSFGSIESASVYFDDFVSNSAGFLDGPVIFFIVFLLLSTLIILRGIKKGVEWASKICLPLLLLILIGLIIYVFTIPGIGPGLEKFFVPNLDDFSSSSVVAAFGQVFFSMSLGQGIMIAYGSYLSKDAKIGSISITTTIVECVVAIMCGLLIVPVVYTMSGGEFASGPGLMFKTLPALFGTMNIGRILGAFFFLMVFFAAWTSAMSMAEAVVTPLHDTCGFSRKKGVMITTGILLVLGMICCLSYGSLSGIQPFGMAISEFFDYVTTNILIPVSSIVMCIVIGFLAAPKILNEEIGIKDGSRKDTGFRIMIKYVCPVILVAIMVAGFMEI